MQTLNIQWEQLKKDFGIELEASAPRHTIAITGIADTEETFERFAKALLAIDADLTLKQATKHTTNSCFRYPAIPETVYDSHAVEDSPAEFLPYSSCEGRISAEFLYLYPPGIPMLVPGECISAELLSCIGQLLENGFSLYGPRRAADKYLQVVREN